MRKVIYMLSLLIGLSLGCANLNPQPETYPTANLTIQSEIETARAQPTINNDEIRQTQFAVAETATAIAPYYPLTQDARMASQTANVATGRAMVTLGVDPFSLTATSIIATATARATSSEIPPTSAYTQWPVISFTYVYGGEEDWQHMAHITEGIQQRLLDCISCSITLPASHEINIEGNYSILDTETLYVILEDAISRLPDYPPFNPEIYETVEVQSDYYPYGIFSYSEALAAYESGLRGADLAEALGIQAP